MPQICNYTEETRFQKVVIDVMMRQAKTFSLVCAATQLQLLPSGSVLCNLAKPRHLWAGKFVADVLESLGELLNSGHLIFNHLHLSELPKSHPVDNI